MMRLIAFAALAATAASFNPRPVGQPLGLGGSRHAPLSRGQGPANPIVMMGGGWVALIDPPTGQVYYKHSLSGESQWEVPQTTTGTPLWSIDGIAGVAGFSGVEGFTCTRDGTFTSFTMGGAVPTSGHVLRDDDESQHALQYGREGRPCQLPYRFGIGDEKVLSRFNMINPNFGVSRGQCTIKCLVDGGAAIFSDGDNPTLIRAPGGQWEALYKDQQRRLNDGDQISLDAANPDGAVFVCNSLSGGGGGGGNGEWVTQIDQGSGQTYYQNVLTGFTQWEPPAGF